MYEIYFICKTLVESTVVVWGVRFVIGITDSNVRGVHRSFESFFESYGNRARFERVGSKSRLHDRFFSL